MVDAREEFAAGYCLPALKANALYMDRYPLVSALSRPLIVQHLARVAREHGASAVAHGCTGKGNDQVRFEVGPGQPGPGGERARPGPRLRHDQGQGDRVRRREGPADRRDRPLALLDRPEPVGRAAARPGTWRTSGRRRTTTSTAYTQDPARAAPDPDEVVISFTDGRPVAIDGRPLTPLQIITELNSRAGAQGVGRVDMVEDRLVGIKSREIYEAPGAIALLAAHSELENVCMERDLARFKRQADQRWTELVYDGLWFSPLKSALEAFMDEASRHVTGDIRLRLHGGRAVVTGRRSPLSLYDYELATYDTGDTFDQSLAKGFVELWGLPSKIAAMRDRRAGG